MGEQTNSPEFGSIERVIPAFFLVCVLIEAELAETIMPGPASNNQFSGKDYGGYSIETISEAVESVESEKTCEVKEQDNSSTFIPGLCSGDF